MGDKDKGEKETKAAPFFFPLSICPLSCSSSRSSTLASGRGISQGVHGIRTPHFFYFPLTARTGNLEIINDLGHPSDTAYLRFDRGTLLGTDRPVKSYGTVVHLDGNIWHHWRKR